MMREIFDIPGEIAHFVSGQELVLFFQGLFLGIYFGFGESTVSSAQKTPQNSQKEGLQKEGQKEGLAPRRVS